MLFKKLKPPLPFRAMGAKKHFQQKQNKTSLGQDFGLFGQYP